MKQRDNITNAASFHRLRLGTKIKLEGKWSRYSEDQYKQEKRVLEDSTKEQNVVIPFPPKTGFSVGGERRQKQILRKNNYIIL